MAINVDRISAERTLRSAYSSRKCLHGETASKITDVLTGSHKTYRYVLFTALLAKATDSRIDVFSLQAQDNSIGAYDARSLCHKVVVKFERDFLPDGLGGSNEPYLNKPARFPRISTTNAVRKGNDTIALQKLISALKSIPNREDAFKYLCHAVYIMEMTHNSQKEKFHISHDDIIKENNIQYILNYISDVVERSSEGEICPIVIASIEQFYLGNNYIVCPHKVNESGASSKEVGDIDIYDTNNNLVFSIEVKDKLFTKEDVEHAVRKFYEGNVSRSFFIYGKNVPLQDKISIFQMLARFGRLGCYCCLINIMDYAKLRLASVQDINFAEFIDSLLQNAKQIKATNETIEWIKETAKSIKDE